MSTQTVPQPNTAHVPPGADDTVCHALQTALVLMVDLQLQATFNQTVVDAEQHAWLLEAEVAHGTEPS